MLSSHSRFRQRGPGPRHAHVLVLVLGVVAIALSACGVSEDSDGGPPIDVPSAPRPITVEWAGELCSAFRPTFEAIDVATPVTVPEDRRAVLGHLRSVDDAARRTTTALTLVGAAPVEQGQPVIERVGRRFDNFRTRLDRAIASLRAPGHTADPARAAAVLDTFSRADVVSAVGLVDKVQDALAYAPACAAYR